MPDGFDFTGFEEESPGDLLLRFVRIETLLQAICNAPGFAFGAEGGADLFAVCTYRMVPPKRGYFFPVSGSALRLEHVGWPEFSARAFHREIESLGFPA